jgi:hypothetical protein
MILERESAGYLLGETAHLLRVNAALTLAALGFMTLLDMVPDLYPDFTGPTGLASFIATLAFQYEISRAVLIHYDLIEGRPGRRRLWALLGLNIVSGIGILLAMLILIVPGVYLFVRWSAALPALIAEEAGVYESFGRSAEAVEGRFWQVLGAILVVWTPFIAGSIAAGLVPEDQPLVRTLLTNLPLNLSLIVGWHLAVAVYAGRQDPAGRLAEVFA